MNVVSALLAKERPYFLSAAYGDEQELMKAIISTINFANAGSGMAMVVVSNLDNKIMAQRALRFISKIYNYVPGINRELEMKNSSFDTSTDVDSMQKITLCVGFSEKKLS